MARGMTPVYLVIGDYLRDLISHAEPGDQLPSENELCERFSVSRMTARQAVSELATEGLLYKVSGSGTFVAQAPVHRRMNRLLSFSEEMRRRGVAPSSRILSTKVRQSHVTEAAALQLTPRDRVIAIRRLRLADSTPMAIEEAIVPATFAPILGEIEAGNSLHEALKRIGRGPVRADGRLTAAVATAEEADLLEIAVGGALLVERRTVRDVKNLPIEWTESRYAGDRFVFDIELEHPGT